MTDMVERLFMQMTRIKNVDFYTQRANYLNTCSNRKCFRTNKILLFAG